MSEVNKTQKCIQLLFPMGGLGTRFIKAGVEVPKPLILLEENIPMIIKAISSFSHINNNNNNNTNNNKDILTSLPLRLIFIIRHEHEEKFKLCTYLKKLFSHENNNNNNNNNNNSEQFSSFVMKYIHQMHIVDVKFILMHHNTRGAVETCLLAKDILYLNAPIVITDCDIYFKSKLYDLGLHQMLNQMDIENSNNNNKLDGLLVYFHSTSPRYSYAVLKENNNNINNNNNNNINIGGEVLKTVEKVPVSNCALIGAYAFATASLFIHAAEALMKDAIISSDNNELTNNNNNINNNNNNNFNNEIIQDTLSHEKEIEENHNHNNNNNNKLIIKEYYISLLYNYIIRWGYDVRAVPMDVFASFGTPEELQRYMQGVTSYMES